MIDGLTRWGATVIHKGNATVHVSGHSSAGELVYCHNVVRPRNVMPVHGQHRHLRSNADLAVSTGVPADRVVIAEDGVVVDLHKGRARISGKVPAGNVYVDAMTVGGVTEASSPSHPTSWPEASSTTTPASIASSVVEPPSSTRTRHSTAASPSSPP